MRLDIQLIEYFKKYIALYLASQVALLSNVYATAQVVQMTGDVDLDNQSSHFVPDFEEGDTIDIQTQGNITADDTHSIGAIRANQDATITLYKYGIHRDISIGSIVGAGNINIDLQVNTVIPTILRLNGTSGVENNPNINDYSALKTMKFTLVAGNFGGPIQVYFDAPIILNTRIETYDNAVPLVLSINQNITLADQSIQIITSGATYSIAVDKSLTLSGSGMNLTSNFDFNDLGILNLSGDNIIFNPSSVSNTGNAVLNIDNNVTTNMPSVLSINTINVADGKSLTIDAINSDIDLLDNNTAINFDGDSASLVLINSGTSDNIFIAYNALIGNILFGRDTILVAKKGVAGSITTTVDNTGTITIGSGNVGVMGTYGESLKLVNLNQTAAQQVLGRFMPLM